MTSTVLSVASRAVLNACEVLGLDVDQLLRSAHAERAQVYDPDARLPTEVADALWQAAITASHDPDLALRAAAALPFGAYKVVDFVVANAPDVRAALERLCRYFAVIDQRAQLELAGDDGTMLRFLAQTGPVPAQAQQYTLAAIILRLRDNTHCPVPLTSVHFTFPAPTDLTLYQHIFQADVHFGAADAALHFSAATLAQPILSANPALLSVLDDHAERLLAELPAITHSPKDFCQQVSDAIATELRGGDLSTATIARHLRVSERTLQRRLHEAGATYIDLLARVRRRVAEDYLGDPGIALSEVAWLLGFADQSAFSRAFKRWTGRSPSAFRSQPRSTDR